MSDIENLVEYIAVLMDDEAIISSAEYEGNSFKLWHCCEESLILLDCKLAILYNDLSNCESVSIELALLHQPEQPFSLISRTAKCYESLAKLQALLSWSTLTVSGVGKENSLFLKRSEALDPDLMFDGQDLNKIANVFSAMTVEADFLAPYLKAICGQRFKQFDKLYRWHEVNIDGVPESLAFH